MQPVSTAGRHFRDRATSNPIILLLQKRFPALTTVLAVASSYPKRSSGMFQKVVPVVSKELEKLLRTKTAIRIERQCVSS